MLKLVRTQVRVTFLNGSDRGNLHHCGTARASLSNLGLRLFLSWGLCTVAYFFLKYDNFRHSLVPSVFEVILFYAYCYVLPFLQFFAAEKLGFCERLYPPELDLERKKFLYKQTGAAGLGMVFGFLPGFVDLLPESRVSVDVFYNPYNIFAFMTFFFLLYNYIMIYLKHYRLEVELDGAIQEHYIAFQSEYHLFIYFIPVGFMLGRCFM